jgi:hypothetical protein
MDVDARELARELNLPVAEVLRRADAIIGETAERDGIDAARGLTTRTRREGQGTIVVVSPRLADALRGKP